VRVCVKIFSKMNFFLYLYYFNEVKPVKLYVYETSIF
jgi:hypothetical protein